MKLAGFAAAGFVALSCSSTATTSPSTTGHPAGTTSPLANAAPVSGGCGSTQLYTGGMPAWLHNGIHGLTGMDDVPYTVAGPTPVAGFIMSYPLKAGPDVPKILWVVGTPRNGGALSIQARPSGSSEPVVKRFTSTQCGSWGDLSRRCADTHCRMLAFQPAVGHRARRA